MTVRVSIGPMKGSEVGFVLSAWKKSLRQTPANAQLPSKVFFDRANVEVDEILAGASVLVARDEENPAFAYGFIAYETRGDDICVHWCSCRHGFRRQGLARKLLAAALEGTVDGGEQIYTAKTRFDAVAERYGFAYRNAFRAMKDFRGTK